MTAKQADAPAAECQGTTQRSLVACQNTAGWEVVDKWGRTWLFCGRHRGLANKYGEIKRSEPLELAAR